MIFDQNVCEALSLVSRRTSKEGDKQKETLSSNLRHAFCTFKICQPFSEDLKILL